MNMELTRVLACETVRTCKKSDNIISPSTLRSGVCVCACVKGACSISKRLAITCQAAVPYQPLCKLLGKWSK